MSKRTFTRPLHWAVLAAMTACGLALVVAPDAQAASTRQDNMAAAAGATGSSSPDTQPPTTPTNLTVSYRCDSSQGAVITLNWTASTDNVGVTGYDVYAAQGTSGSFAPVATTTTTSYTQRYALGYFEVRARDAAGNTSAFTAPVLVVPLPSPCPAQSSSASASASASSSADHGTCTAAYHLGASWPGGFQGQVTVTNAGTGTTASWTVSLTFANGQTITQLWGASTTSTGSPYTLNSLSYDSALAPGASTTFGFLGSWNGTNTAPTVTCTRSP